jgi:hypothetical protein
LQKAINSKPICQLIRTEGEENILKTVIALIIYNSEYFLVRNKMSDGQAIQIASLFIEHYGTESLEDLMLCLKYAKINRYGTSYNRLDGQIIFQWFQQYLDEKYQEVEKQRLEQKAEIMEKEIEVLSHVSGQMLNGISERLTEHEKPKEISNENKHWQKFLEVVAHAEPEQLQELLEDYTRHLNAGNKTVTPYIEAIKSAMSSLSLKS